MIIPQTGVPNLCIPAAAAAMNQHVAGGGWQPGWRETRKTKTYIRFHLFPLNSRIWGNTRNVQFFCPNPYGQKKLSFWFSRYIYICKPSSHPSLHLQGGATQSKQQTSKSRPQNTLRCLNGMCWGTKNQAACVQLREHVLTSGNTAPTRFNVKLWKEQCTVHVEVPENRTP